MSQKPSLPKGTRDFGPEQMSKRNFILNNIKKVFQKYGFMPLETPAMENLSVLTGKYGDEGDQLLFKVLNSGDYLSKASEEDIQQGSKKLLPKISEKGLKYDLTVPFARYVVMNQHNIAYPFKRYQIQPVWRADRPQRGRYREFFQCDADVIGTNSLICESEIIAMITEVFALIGIKDYTIKINHRKILTGITEAIGASGKENEFCVAVDKLDKIGLDKVLEELSGRGLSEASLQKVVPFLQVDGSNVEKLAQLRDMLEGSEVGMQGVLEIEEILELVQAFDFEDFKMSLDTKLARGLSYYTGTIFEVQVNNVSIGSVSGGGRYDDLTGVFGVKGLSGVGFSFGVDRLYDVMEELGLFPDSTSQYTKVLIVHFDRETQNHGLKVLSQIRKADISAEIYPDQSKIKKQFAYADKKNIPFTLIIGSDEISSGQLTLRNMQSGEELKLTSEQVVAHVASKA